MNNLLGGMSQNSWLAWILFLAVWTGVGFLVYLAVSKVKEKKTKKLLAIGLTLVLGALFLGSLLGNIMFLGFMGCNQSMMKSQMKEMMRDSEIKDMIKENDDSNSNHESHHKV